MTFVLDEFILSKVAKWLPLEERFTLQRVSKSFQNVLRQSAWIVVHISELLKKLGEKETTNLLEKYGRHTQVVVFKKETHDQIVSLLNNFRFLVSVEIGRTLEIKQLVIVCEALAKKYPRLAKLKVSYLEAGEREKITPFNFPFMKFLCLKDKTVTSRGSITSLFVHPKNLKLVYVQYYSHSISEEIIFSFHEYCPNLRKLRLSGKVSSVALETFSCKWLFLNNLTLDLNNKTSTAMNSFTFKTENFPSLRKLSIRGDKDLEGRMNSRYSCFEEEIPSMKTLILHTISIAGYASFPSLFTNITELILFKCKYVTDNVVSRLLSQLPNLANLNLSGKTFGDNAFLIHKSHVNLTLRKLCIAESGPLGEAFMEWLLFLVPNLLFLDLSYTLFHLPSNFEFPEEHELNSLYLIDISHTTHLPLVLLDFIPTLPSISIVQFEDNNKSISNRLSSKKSSLIFKVVLSS